MNPYRPVDRQVQWLPSERMLAQTRAGSGVSPVDSAFRVRERLQGLRGQRSRLRHISYTRGDA